ncbi:MAG TPA: hypothetical protein VI564_07415 [Candidatus Nanoarchaeia archaeon]|nr:hypothetical protein [Candidatus Nanoarchaeia archaeon]
MDKKAILDETLVILIIFLVVAGILIAFTYSFVTQSKKKGDIEVCRTSALAQSIELKTLGALNPTGSTTIPLDCPRRVIKIYDNKVEINGKKAKEYPIGKNYEDSVKKVFAEELRLCWYKLLEGKGLVFENPGTAFGDNNICLICSSMEFDVNSDNIHEIKEFINYLKENKIPKNPQTYFDYLAVAPKSKIKENYLKVGQFSDSGGDYLVPDILKNYEKYSMFFIGFKPTWAAEDLGDKNSFYTVTLSKEANVDAKICDIILN